MKTPFLRVVYLTSVIWRKTIFYILILHIFEASGLIHQHFMNIC